jgi:2-(1,2-epoxy-1,2-dihydrophenyl)acetyl-CoA isomerase
VTRTVDDEMLASEGDAVAARLVAAPVAAFGAARALLLESFDGSFEAQLDRELRSMVTAASAEAREGLAAFFAKRPPDFTGT